MALFISHSDEEEPLAAALSATLKLAFGDSFQVFVAKHRVPLGADWLEKIREALENAQAILVLLSARSVGRPWVNIEAGYGVMARKKVIPLCHSGFSKAQLPHIYESKQSVDLADRQDVERLLSEIQTLSSTPLRADCKKLANELRTMIAAARLRVPSSLAETDDRPCVWLIGTNSGLENKQAAFNRRFMALLAHAMTGARLQCVFGRSELLDDFAGSLLAEQAQELSTDADIVESAAEAAATYRDDGSIRPNPVIVLGSLRTFRGPRALFLESIGRVPDVTVLVGGKQDGRARQEAEFAQRAGIPLLPVAFTGGYAQSAACTLDDAFKPEADRLRHDRKDYARVPAALCDLIVRQTAIVRARQS
ncbi:MAG: toll/interleukin-1 receptor domain-containing protein [Nitrospira sp.]|nr:toll/interleukin-1 receptor domain-containing protein [Nitrospira sp.]